MTDHLFIFGYGFSSQAIAAQCKDQFSTVTGTTRSAEKATAIASEGINAQVFDGSTLTSKLKESLRTATHLVVSIGPKETDPVLDCLTKDLKEYCPSLHWVGYLSTVGVYGNHDGAWVTETDETRPVSKRSKWRVAAEQAWKDKTKKSEMPLSIFRLSGIYGPGRNAFINIEKGTARRLVKPGQVFNRIHRDDIGQAVKKAIEKNASGIFNITDNEPAPPQDVVEYAHQLMGVTPPPEIDFETADITPMARSFYGENKRVSNEKSKQILGMEYIWPDYKTSLKRMLDDNSWQSV